MFEAVRLIMIQILLSEDGQRMDPLVSLYYYAPVCAAMNMVMVWYVELASFRMDDFARVGFSILLCNALVAFMLNVSSVFLVISLQFLIHKGLPADSKTDWQDKRPCHNPDGYLQKHPFSGHQRLALGYCCQQPADFRILCGPFWVALLLSSLGDDKVEWCNIMGRI